MELNLKGLLGNGLVPRGIHSRYRQEAVGELRIDSVGKLNSARAERMAYPLPVNIEDLDIEAEMEPAGAGEDGQEPGQRRADERGGPEQAVRGVSIWMPFPAGSRADADEIALSWRDGDGCRREGDNGEQKTRRSSFFVGRTPP
jgi:hypothetical protein